MTNTKQLAIRGVMFNWMGRFCSFVIIFFLTPFLVRQLGDNDYGLWSIVMGLTSYYALADMGLRGAGTKYIAQFAAVDDRESIDKVMVTSLVVYAVMSLVVILVVLAATWAFPYVFPVKAERVTMIRWVVLLTGLTVSIRLFGQVFGASLTALHRFDVSNAISVGTQLLQAAAVVAALVAGTGLVGMAAATLAVSFVTQLITAVVAVRLMRPVSFGLSHFSTDTLKMVFSFGSVTVFTHAVERAATQIGKVFIGAFYGPALVTYFAIPDSLARQTRSIGFAIRNVMHPLASHLEAQKREDVLAEVLVTGSRILTALGMAFLALFLVYGRPLIDLWIGPGYSEQAYPVLCILAVGSAALMSSQASRALLRGTAQVAVLAKIAVGDLFLTVVLGVPLLLKYGLVGMAAATTVAHLTTNGLIPSLYACRVLKVPIPEFWKRVQLHAALATLPTLAAAWLLLAVAPPQHLVTLVLQLGCLSVFAAAGIFFFCVDRQRRQEILDSFLIPRRRGRRSAEALAAGRLETAPTAAGPIELVQPEELRESGHTP